MPPLRTLLPAALYARRFLSTSPNLSAAGPLACRLQSRSVIRLRGPDAIKFLQNLVTNDVRPLAEDVSSTASNIPTPNIPLITPPPVYAAMLTPEGRFLYDLFLYRKPRGEEKLDSTGTRPGQKEPLTVLADVDAEASDELLEHLKKNIEEKMEMRPRSTILCTHKGINMCTHLFQLRAHFTCGFYLQKLELAVCMVPSVVVVAVARELGEENWRNFSFLTIKDPKA